MTSDPSHPSRGAKRGTNANVHADDSSGASVSVTTRVSGADSEGAYSLFELRYTAAVANPAALAHTSHDELFYVLDGRLILTVDGQTHTLEPGQTYLVGRGSSRQCGAPSDQSVHFLVTTSPPTEELDDSLTSACPTVSPPLTEAPEAVGGVAGRVWKRLGGKDPERWRRTRGNAVRAYQGGRTRFESSLPGHVWGRLSAVDFIDSSVQFSANFIMSFLPFLLLASALIGFDLSRAVVARTGFDPRAAADVTTLFSHGSAPVASVSIVGLVLIVVGANGVSVLLQGWYGKVFGRVPTGLKAHARRAQWLTGVIGFVSFQVMIGRRVGPLGGEVATAAGQFFLALIFWWWSLHCLLAGEVGWRRLFPAGLATAVCYNAVALYWTYFAPSSIVSDVAAYGPIGAVMNLLEVLVALGVAIHLGAVIGALYSRKQTHPAT